MKNKIANKNSIICKKAKEMFIIMKNSETNYFAASWDLNFKFLTSG
jgi:hypothetical protein